MLTVQQADKITQDWIESHVDLNQARQNYAQYPFRRESEKLTRPNYDPGDWVIDEMGVMSVLVEVNVSDIRPSEKEWELALQYETTQQYIEWFKQGYQPPPIFVIRNAKSGQLLSMNRRRWLAAREAGVETLRAFYSPTLPSGRPAWELRPCTWDKTRVCREYAKGGDCFSCPFYAHERDTGGTNA